MKKERLIIKPFNKVFNILCLIFFLFAVLSSYLINHNDETFGYKYVLVITIINVVLFVLCRVSFYFDKEYIEILYKDYGKINYYNELPFYPCNLVMLLTPVAIIFNNCYLLSFCFYFSIIGPLLAIVFPCLGFSGYSFLKPRICGFYLTHIICLLYPVLLVCSKIFIPTYKDCLTMILVSIVFSIFAHFLNIYLIKTNKNKDANYFFTMFPNDNIVMQKSYELIPHRFFWLVPMFVLIYLLCIVFTAIVKLI